MQTNHFLLLIFFASIFLSFTCVHTTTDPSDVQALQVLYTSLNNAAQLTNWKPNNGDPCGESWRGVTCEGSAVVSIELPDLGIDGTLGYMLSSFTSLKTLDLSGNNIHDAFPYQLPPNLTSLKLANNNLSGNIPYSISLMYNLNYMNLSHNMLAQNVGDIFNNLTSLTTLDLSHNNFSGDLPTSLSSLSSISTFHVQNNQLTGSLNSLAGLPLTDLNVANNRFNGWIPKELLSVPTFIYDGNSFDNGPAPPPPPYTPPPAKPHNNRTRSPPPRTHKGSDAPASDTSSGKKLSLGTILGISLGSAFFILFTVLVLLFCLRKGKKTKRTPRTSTVNPPVIPEKVNAEMQEQRVIPTASVVDLKTPPNENSTYENGKSGSMKRVKSPITTSSYTVATLQTATNSFSQDNIIGEGSLGRVYKADFPNGKMMAVKKIDNAALSLQEEDDFVEAVSNMSRLRHPNIVPLGGYCPEPEFRPPMSEVVQALVRLMQRASVVKRRPSDDSGFIYKTPDHEAYEMSY
ncbi:hypothetical protein M8C21_007713 [Ambrosia artemisiifolia]|uniref:Protein kinase domain-containing protein n=1 Tax=Ambrosia artemisiifolia TaxID=4212 RepID=A0AAD5CR92_AMBAR|nr:hypothetical protein M8C21_007713 [Ambrosia artemisiifolia]